MKTTENARVTKLVIDEKLFNPLIESQIEIECRKAYMPCFLIYFSSSVVNAESKPNAITDVIPDDANLRVIVNGSCGSVLGPRIYSYINVLKYMSIFTSFTVLPITSLLMYYPVQNAIAISFLTGLFLQYFCYIFVIFSFSFTLQFFSNIFHTSFFLSHIFLFILLH